MRLAGFQRQFVEGAFADGVNIGCLSVGRGNGKTGLAAALGVTHLLGEWGAQPQREIVVAARTRDQAQTCFNFCRSFIGEREDVKVRRGAALEIEVDAPDGPHLLKAVASTGKRTVAVQDWLAQVLAHVEGEAVATILADRFTQSELGDGLDALGCKIGVAWRGFGWRDGAEDIERFRRAVYDRRVAALRSLLMRSALADAVCLIDPAGNPKLAKGRAMGRIDPAAAAILAVAEGQRMVSRPQRRMRAARWA